ncbi:MAG: two-component regulator propeller domain-containing protein [Chitinophagaceae bacterium]
MNNIKKDSFAAPTITHITALNQPKKVKAGKPIVEIDSSNGGAPFFTNYSTEQGLPLNSVFCSATDKAGNLWFGTTGGGVSKYDGKSFTNYTIAQGLAGNVVRYITEDKDSNLWFGTTSGASKYDGYRFANYTTEQGLGGNFISSILQDIWGNLWFGTQDGGASKFDGKIFTNYTTAHGLADNDIRCMMQDRSGNIWFGTAAGGVSKHDGKTFINYTTAQGLAGNSVNSISQDKAGNLWFGTSAGVSKYQGNNFTNYTTTQGLAGDYISCIEQDRNGNLWFGTHSRGVSKYDGSRFTNYTKAQGVADNNISSILQDKAGNLWLTSFGGGVSKYGGNNLTNYTTSQGLTGNFVLCTLQDKAGNLWFGTYEGGVSKFDGKSFTNYTTAQGLADSRVWNMMQDKAGNIWFGTDKGGISKFDGKSFTTYTPAQGIAGNTVPGIMQDKNGNMWFGTNGGASKFDGTCFTNYTTAQGLPGNNIQSIIQDKAGNIWFGTHDNGASKYDGKSFTNYTTAHGLVSNTVYSMIQDNNENIWFATNAGASKYDGKNFINYTTAQGLADNFVWIIVEDQQRNMLWFGTNMGLSGLKLKPSTNSNRQDNEFENFNKNTGYPIKDVSRSPFLVDNKGILWVGSGHQELIRFDYAAVNNNTEALVLKIQDVKVNNEPICWNTLLRMQQGNKAADSLTLLNEMITSFGKVLSPAVLDSMEKKYSDIQLDGVTRFYPVPINLVLPYKDNSISIDFVAIEPALPKQVKYQYKLEGYAKDWSPLSNNSTAVFGNMKQGHYTFKLKAVSPSGVWSETAYSFKVLPPWWATWWAFTLYVLAIGGVGYTLYRNYIQGLKRKQAEQIKAMVATQEEERKRISRDLHDDIGARLTNINILSALGQQKINEPQEMSEYLKRISNEIQTSAEALDDIVWSIDSKNNSIEEVTARMRGYAADVFDGTPIRYTIEANEKSLPEKLSIGQRRDLFFVFKEAINNIQKHAMATEVTINLEAKDNNLLMQVTDNGKGFDADQPTHRNGLKNMQQRMQKWGGTCTVQSSPGKGTILKIELPVLTPSLKKGMWAWFKSR